MKEAKVIYAGMRESEGFIDIVCRFSNDEKFDAIQVDVKHKELARAITNFLNSKEYKKLYQEKPKPIKNQLDFYTISNDILPIAKEWVEYRKSIKKPFNQLMLNKLPKQLVKLAKGHNVEEFQQIIDQSISNGWQGLFELKSNVSWYKNDSNVTQNNHNVELSAQVETAIKYIEEIGVVRNEKLISNVLRLEQNVITAQEYYGKYIKKEHPFLDKCPDIDEYVDKYTIWLSNQKWVDTPTISLFNWENGVHQKFFLVEVEKIWGDRVKKIMYNRETFEQMIKSKGK